MDKIYYSVLNKDQIETYKGFEIYCDNPQKVAVNKLESEAGCILDKLSALFSLIKLYPALNKFALNNHCSDDSAVMEIYDIPNIRESFTEK